MDEYRSYDNRVLVDLLAKSDELAFMEIYDRYWQKIFTIAHNRLNNTPEAEDVVHDVFASLWANRASQQIEILENYIAVAAKYIVLSKIRTKLRERKYQETAGTALVVEMPVETALHYKRILMVVKTEVEKLPEKCRIIFKYSRNEGMTVKQIAQVLDISPKTVENQLNKALKHLRTAVRTFLPVWHCIVFLVLG